MERWFFILDSIKGPWALEIGVVVSPPPPHPHPIQSSVNLLVGFESSHCGVNRFTVFSQALLVANIVLSRFCIAVYNFLPLLPSPSNSLFEDAVLLRLRGNWGDLRDFSQSYFLCKVIHGANFVKPSQASRLVSSGLSANPGSTNHPEPGSHA